MCFLLILHLLVIYSGYSESSFKLFDIIAVIILKEFPWQPFRSYQTRYIYGTLHFLMEVRMYSSLHFQGSLFCVHDVEVTTTQLPTSPSDVTKSLSKTQYYITLNYHNNKK